MTELLAVFLGGFLGSAHCVGMCGGLAALVGVPTCTPSQTVVRQLVYSLGRIFTYSFLGLVVGYSGARLSQSELGLAALQRYVSIAAGLIMILIGLSTLGWLKLRFALPAGWDQSFAQLLSRFLQARSRTTTFVAGVINGFLPCGLVYAFLSLALASDHPWHGALLMAVFGLGTVPAMTLVGCGSSMVSHHQRARIFRLAACLVMVTGIVTIYRALPTPSNCCATPEETS